jgi:hypothetical protein
LFALANICLFVGLLLDTFRTDGGQFKFWTRQPAASATAGDLAERKQNAAELGS